MPWRGKGPLWSGVPQKWSWAEENPGCTPPIGWKTPPWVKSLDGTGDLQLFLHIWNFHICLCKWRNRWHGEMISICSNKKSLHFIQCPRHIVQVSFLLSPWMLWTQGQVGVASSVWDVPPSLGGLLLWKPRPGGGGKATFGTQICGFGAWIMSWFDWGKPMVAGGICGNSSSSSKSKSKGVRWL